MSQAAGWLQGIPSEWQRKKLKYVASLKSGDSITSDDIAESGEYPVFGGNGIRGYASAYTHEGRHVLIGRQGALCGNINYATGRFWASEHAVVATIKADSNVTWLGELLRSMNLNQYSQSAAQPGLAVDVIANLEIPVPPLRQQRAIAGFLDRETARLDALVAAKERVLVLLAEKRRALITHAVIRGLDQHVHMRDTGIEWIPQVPRHWTPTKISRLFRQTKRLGFADLTVLSVYRDYGVIVRASRDDNVNRVPDDLEKYQLVERGDLVINKMKAWQGSLGIAELNGITSPDYVVFSPLHRAVPKFLHYLLRNQILTTVYMSMSNGIRTSQWRLEPERFCTLQLFLPPIDEQRAIVGHIDGEIAKLDPLNMATESTIALLKERRAALITAAVTGRINVVEANI